MWVLYIFWRSGPCLRYDWQICFPILLVLFVIWCCFFSHAEAFYFDEVPFVYSFLYVPCFRGCVCEDVAVWNVWDFPVCFELLFYYPSLNGNLILGNIELIISGIFSDKFQIFPFLPRISPKFCGYEWWGGLHGSLCGWIWDIVFWLAPTVDVNYLFSNRHLSLGLYQGGKTS